MTVQWFKNGDHPDDNCETFIGSDGLPFQGEGKVVRYFRHPEVSGEKVCERCGFTMNDHGWIDSGGDGRTVCPGDCIEKRDDGYYPVKRGELKKADYLVLDVSNDDARAIHRVIRALHDGECPFCHAIFSSTEVERPDGSERCPRCNFTITKDEREAAIEMFGPRMARSMEVFLRWRDRAELAKRS